MSIILKDLLCLGFLDIEFIDYHYSLVKDDVDFSLLDNLVLRDFNGNLLLDMIFTCLNEKIFTSIIHNIENSYFEIGSEALKENVLKACQERIDNFLPFLNFLDSFFNNELDNVQIEERSLDQIAADVFPIILKNVEN